MKTNRNLLRIFFFLLFCVFLISEAVIAKDAGLSINADNIEYSKDPAVIRAAGSVEVEYKGMKINAGKLIYDKTSGKASASKGFSLSRRELEISGETLSYTLKTETGSAENVQIAAHGTWISGKKIKIESDFIEMNDASFSSCPLETPMYKISASNLTYYENTGWIVLYGGFLWFREIPIFPVLTYVYDTGNVLGRKKKNPLPLPEIGSNSRDGFFIKSKTIFRLSGFSYGALGIDYAINRGFGGGMEGNYILSNYNEGSARMYYSKIDGFSSGLTHTYYFGADIENQDKKYFLYEVFEETPKKIYTATTSVSYREDINYEKVTFLPKLTLDYTNVPFKLFNLTPSASISMANVTEESSGANMINSNISLGLGFEQPLDSKTTFSGGLDLKTFTYAQYGSWTRLSARGDIDRQLPASFEASVGFTHLFVNEGLSPFRYENYRYFPSDEIRGKLQFNTGFARIGVSAYYNYPLFTIRDLDYNATVGFRCFDAGITYRSARNEFLMEINLVSK